ncbi:MAG: hypothetical protein ACI4TC_04095, partial [Kiritimatiellia bacterium]
TDEIQATNPRIERRGDVVTHVEVFGAFETRPDGSVKTRVAESAIDMDAITAQLWVREAKVAIGAAMPTMYSKYKAYLALRGAGVWPQVKAWLEANDLWDAFLIANDFSEDDPLFKKGVAELQAVVGWTDEQIAALLALCLAD